MPTTVLNATFNGIDPVTALNGGTREFFGGFLGYYSMYEGTAGQDFTANVSLEGSDWTVAAMRFGNQDRTNLTVITDTATGEDRRINSLELGFNSDVTLEATRVRYIVGYDGDEHIVRLGSEGVASVDLYALVNQITSSSGYVGNIDTNGTSTISIGTGGAGQINTSTGNDEVMTAGYVRAIRTGDGNDRVIVGDQGAGFISTGNGRDRVETGVNYVDAIKTGGDKDYVSIGAGGAGIVGTGEGDDKVFAEGYVEFLSTRDGNDKVQIGDSGAGLVDTGDGRDRIDTGTGFVEVVRAGAGNDVINVGSGQVLTVRAEDGDDLIRVQALDNASGGVAIFGGNGRDKLDFSLITTVGVTFSLDEAGAFQNIGGASITEPPVLGYFAEVGVEDIVGTQNNDAFTGGTENNQFIGGLGDDTLKGGAGVDRLYGNTGDDSLEGGTDNDFLFGGKNNDVLAGGEGFDRLDGGRGSDTFVFADNGGTDRVFGYEGDRDVIRILGHIGDFSSLGVADQGADLAITYDGGVILLVDQAGITLDQSLIDVVSF